MADDLEARLQGHARAFEGLMSLLPPDLYYGKQSTGDEWNKKKQTKAEKKAAKRAKLDPANHKTAKDVADERERKRRLEEEAAEAGLDVSALEKPFEGVKQPKVKVQKNTKEQDVHSKKDGAKSDAKKSASNQSDVKSKEEKRKANEPKLKEKKTKKAAASTDHIEKKQTPSKTAQNSEEPMEVQGEVVTMSGAEDALPDDEMDAVDVSGLVPEEHLNGRNSTSRSASPEPTFSPGAHQSTSSISSIQPPSEDDPSNTTSKGAPEPSNNEPKETPEEAKRRRQEQLARLHELITKHKEARSADGLNGKPARNRTELIEARRIKEQKRKEKKKEIRQKDKEEQKKAEFEAHLSSLRGSPVLGSGLFAPPSRSGSISGSRSPSVANANNNFSFGRVAFSDGARLNSNLSGLVEGKTLKKGPSDAKTALLAAQKHQAKINGLDAGKKQDIEQKDLWLNARKKVNGERVRDDLNLLKKSLKRKEKTKSKSEKEWNERTEGVKHGQDMRQKKREDNLAKRREEKGGKKKGSGGVKKSKAKGKPKKRAGFEGTFKGRS